MEECRYTNPSEVEPALLPNPKIDAEPKSRHIAENRGFDKVGGFEAAHECLG